MKKLICIVVVLLFSMQYAMAQYGRQNRMRGMSGAPVTSAPKPEEVTALDLVEERLPEYQAEFELDPFETEVLRTYLEDYFNKLIALQKSGISDVEIARKEYERLQNDFKSDLSSIMTEEEVFKLIAMDFSPRAKRKRKKDKDDSDN